MAEHPCWQLAGWDRQAMPGPARHMLLRPVRRSGRVKGRNNHARGGNVTEKEPKGIDAKLRRIEQLFAERKRDDYESLRARLTEARDLFHDAMAERFTEAFNAHLAAQPQATLAEKQALSRDANADLRALGLAVRCPKTGDPAMLHGDRGYRPDAGRFQLLLLHSGGHTKTKSSTSLFQVDLMGFPNRREPLAEYWASRTQGEKKSPRSR